MQRAYYLANVTMIDEKVGLIMDALEEAGYLENAVVVFTSDHGDCLTDHGHSQKWTMYDLITRVPLVVWANGREDILTPEGGRQVDGLCQQMDIGPALLELAGVMPPEHMEAESLLPALKGDDWRPREMVFAEHGRDGILEETEFMTMARTDEWKLVYFLDEPFGQLFNLKSDPDETRNLWDDPNCQEAKRELLDALLNWRMRSSYRTRRLFENAR